MKKLKILVPIFSIIILFVSCDKITELIEGGKKQDPNEISGTTTLPLNEVGNTIDVGSVNVGGKY